MCRNNTDSKKSNKISSVPVMKSHCKTCPFKPNAVGIFQNIDLANTVIDRNLFHGQQVCHGTEGENREVNNRCKGYYDYSLNIYNAIGIDPELLHKVLNDPNFNEEMIPDEV